MWPSWVPWCVQQNICSVSLDNNQRWPLKDPCSCQVDKNHLWSPENVTYIYRNPSNWLKNIVSLSTECKGKRIQIKASHMHKLSHILSQLFRLKYFVCLWMSTSNTTTTSYNFWTNQPNFVIFNSTEPTTYGQTVELTAFYCLSKISFFL